MSVWSPEFLEVTSRLIDEVRKLPVKWTVLDHRLLILPLVSPDLLQQTWVYLMKHPDSFRSKLTFDQFHVLDTCFHSGLIETLDDFHYLLNHLPFYVPVMEVITDWIRYHIPLHEVDVPNPYLSPLIQSWIYQHCRYLDQYQIQINPHTRLHLRILHENPRIKSSQLIDSICRIVQMIQTLHSFSPTKESINLLYIMTPFRKRLRCFNSNPTLNHLLRRELSRDPTLLYNYQVMTNPITNLSVNSGVTSRGSTHASITIWREEELEKVLIHELIHYYDLEKGEEFTPPLVNISNNYPSHSKELFTELQTWYLYIIYHNAQKTNSVLPQVVLDRERWHSWEMLCRILGHYHISQWEQWIRSPIHASSYRLNVGSSVVYYYLFKALILSEIDPWIERLLFPSPVCRGCRLRVTTTLVDKLTERLHEDHPIQLFSHGDSLRMMET